MEEDGLRMESDSDGNGLVIVKIMGLAWVRPRVSDLKGSRLRLNTLDRGTGLDKQMTRLILVRFLVMKALKDRSIKGQIHNILHRP
jgi:hypothetical protein